MSFTSKPVPPGIRYETDPSLPAGTDRFIEGQPGELLEIWEVTYRNGEEVERHLAESRGIVKAPVDSVHYVGPEADKDAHPTLDAPGFNGTYTKKLRVWATWYDARHGGKTRDDPYYGITATGLKIKAKRGCGCGCVRLRIIVRQANRLVVATHLTRAGLPRGDRRFEKSAVGPGDIHGVTAACTQPGQPPGRPIRR